MVVKQQKVEHLFSSSAPKGWALFVRQGTRKPSGQEVSRTLLSNSTLEEVDRTVLTKGKRLAPPTCIWQHQFRPGKIRQSSDISKAATTMFIAWQYPTSALTQLYAVSTLRRRPIPSSLWNPGYSGKLRFKSFSISSMASESRPVNLDRVFVYNWGSWSRRKRDPDVISHISPRNRLGRPTRISLWNVGCLMRVALRPLSKKYSSALNTHKAPGRPDLGSTLPTIASCYDHAVSEDHQDTERRFQDRCQEGHASSSDLLFSVLHLPSSSLLFRPVFCSRGQKPKPDETPVVSIRQ